MPKIFGKHIFHGLFHKDKHHEKHDTNMEKLIGKKASPPLHRKEKSFPKLVLEDVVLKDMRVLIRVDFNVPMKEMKVANNYKIKQTIPTLEYCFKNGAKSIILMSHLGRPEGRVEPSYSLKPVAEELENLLGKPVTFLDDCVGEKVEAACADPPEGSVILLENLRFHPEEQGKGKNDKFEDIEPSEAEILEFRMALSRLGDVYVNDAFGICHRSHSSVVGITKVQRACGLLLKKEIDTFNQVLEKPEKPVIAIIGGAKVADKLPAIENLLDLANEIILVGGMAFTFLKDAEGMKIGKSLYEEGQKDTIKGIMEQAHEKKVKILLPEDFVIADKNEEDVEDKQCSAKDGIPKNQMGLDIGFESCKKFAEIIKEGKTIVWNGPAGVCENDKFTWGTTALLTAVIDASKCGAHVIIGGGETVAAVQQLGCADELPALSTGGGACLHLLQGKKLPGFEALSSADVNEPKQKGDDVLQETDPKTDLSPTDVSKRTEHQHFALVAANGCVCSYLLYNMPKIFGMHFFNGLLHKDKQQHDHSNVTNLIGKKTLPILHHEKHPFPKLVMEDVVLKDMRVLIRVDFDVPIKQKRVANNYKIKQAIPTIEYCFKHGAKAVILMSHLGKPDGHVEKTYTLKPVAEELALLLGKKVTFLEDCVGVKVEEACADPPEGSVILLENVRFHVEGKGKGTNAKREDIQASEAKISEFRMALSRLGDVYVNEAFAVSHRNHSSIVGITNVQRACGLQLKKEIDTFNHVLDKPEKPVVAIFGGAKVADKIPAIEHLLDVANEIIIVGGISYTFLKDVKGVNIGKSLYDDGQKDAIIAIMKQAREKKVKIHLPEDFVIAARNEEDVEDNQCSAKYGIPENQMGLDIGFETTEHFAKIIKGAKTIVWNGPAGVCENEKFTWGTKALLAAVIGANNTGARVIIGGGDTVTAVHQLGYADEIPTLSTGGGACLHLLKGKKLPGFEALSSADVNEPKQKGDDVLQETDPKTGKPREKKPGDSVNTGQTIM